jgi:hypothetical protein
MGHLTSTAVAAIGVRPAAVADAHHGVRYDRVDKAGRVTLRDARPPPPSAGDGIAL